MLRTIYICYKDIEKDFNEINEETILFEIFGIRDIIRKGVREAVLKCKEASINIIMVTGDNIQTAYVIAKECNIIDSKSTLFNEFETEVESLSHPQIEINGDTFYEIIGGLIYSTCGKTSNDCKCPKTNSRANFKKIKNSNTKIKK